MALVRWEPFRDLVNLQNSINRLFDENYSLFRLPDGNNLTQGLAFPVDIKDTADAVVIKAEIPGVKREDVSVIYNENILTIRGERKHEEKEEGASYIKVERRYGSFSRSFSLDVPVDHEKIKASYKDGILEINLPKKEKAKSKEIDIEVN
ncbi:MAG: Hsp20/alpha crystallin family protein [Bacillota bacterium]